jgi:hypothetical protein
MMQQLLPSINLFANEQHLKEETIHALVLIAYLKAVRSVNGAKKERCMRFRDFLTASKLVRDRKFYAYILCMRRCTKYAKNQLNDATVFRFTKGRVNNDVISTGTVKLSLN